MKAGSVQLYPVPGNQTLTCNIQQCPNFVGAPLPPDPGAHRGTPLQFRQVRTLLNIPATSYIQFSVRRFGSQGTTGKTMIIVLMGVTGSGKTTVGKLLADELGWKYYDADDFHSPANIEKMKRGIPLDDVDRKPWLESLRDLIRNRLERAENGVIACSALKASYRNYLLVNDEVRLIYLKGDYELIHKRLSDRSSHYMNPKLLDSQFDLLEEPKGHLAIDVSSSPAEIVKNIREHLGL